MNMKTNRLFLDVHILQTVPPSCVNRDDTGSPKTAVYGGATRARVSSQAWKKATRDAFKVALLEEGDIGLRTKNILDLIYDDLQNKQNEADAYKYIEEVLTAANLKQSKKKDKKAEDSAGALEQKEDDGKNKKEMGALFFISPQQVKAIAELTREYIKKEETLSKEEFKAWVKGLKASAIEALNSAPTIDIALFGRMVAENVELNVDASCQVAHAISTHRVENEYDYFTAVDDCANSTKMIGTIEYNSSTLYRYATIAIRDLEKQLGSKEESATAAKNFLQAFITSMPTGKINTFANNTSPDYVLITLRTDTPVNLVGAFEKPIIADADEGYVSKSIEALENKANEVYKNWYSEPASQYVIGVDGNLDSVIEKVCEELMK
jgi:CRISPR system Cascade subunit CasC